MRNPSSPIMSCLCIFLIHLFTLSGCTESSSGQERASDQEEEIKEVLTDMWDAIEKGDIERYASHVHPDFTQFGETDPTLNIGKEVEVSAILEWMKTSSNVHTEMEEPRITIKGKVGWIAYYWNDRGMSNGEPFASRGKSTRIFIKENGRWLCIHGHYTLLP